MQSRKNLEQLNPKTCTKAAEGCQLWNTHVWAVSLEVASPKCRSQHQCQKQTMPVLLGHTGCLHTPSWRTANFLPVILSRMCVDHKPQQLQRSAREGKPRATPHRAHTQLKHRMPPTSAVLLLLQGTGRWEMCSLSPRHSISVMLGQQWPWMRAVGGVRQGQRGCPCLLPWPSSAWTSQWEPRARCSAWAALSTACAFRSCNDRPEAQPQHP